MVFALILSGLAFAQALAALLVQTLQRVFKTFLFLAKYSKVFGYATLHLIQALVRFSFLVVIS
jgi:hypothetical protein